MNYIGNDDNHLADGDGAVGDDLGGVFSLADTLEEDRERYQDVIHTLDEFEEEQGTRALEPAAPDEDIHGRPDRASTPVA